MPFGREIQLEGASAETLISDLVYSEISPRLANYLSRNGITTLGDLAEKHSLLGPTSYGRASRAEVRDLLQRWRIDMQRAHDGDRLCHRQGVLL